MPETSAIIPQPRTTIERRARVRFACARKSSCRPTTQEGQWPAQARNISAAGLNLFLNRRFERGSLLVIELSGITEDSSCMLLASVIWVAPRPEGGWIVGCKLSQELSQDELTRLRIPGSSVRALLPR